MSLYRVMDWIVSSKSVQKPTRTIRTTSSEVSLIKTARLGTRLARGSGGEIVVSYGRGCYYCGSFALSFQAGWGTRVAQRPSGQ